MALSGQGLEVLLQIEISNTFTTVAGLRGTTITKNDEPIDVTSKSSNGFRELLAGAGNQSVSVSGNGVFTDSAAENALRTAMQAQRNRNSDNSADQDPVFEDFKVLVPLMGATANDTTLYTMTFKGMIASLEYAGEYNGEVTYTVTVESAGAVTVGTS